MTIERRKALLVIMATLVVGILIGALGHAMVARQYHRGEEGRKSDPSSYKEKKRRGEHMRERFIKKVFDVTEATEAQQAQLRPVLERTALQIDSVRAGSEQQIKTLADRMMAEITPMLDAAQVAELKKFFERISRDRGKK